MKITCTLPHASEEINGIGFERQDDGSVVATGVDKEAAEGFKGINGYTVEDDGKTPAKEADKDTEKEAETVVPDEPVKEAEPAAPAVEAKPEKAPAAKSGK